MVWPRPRSDRDRGLDLAATWPWPGNGREQSTACPCPQISRALAGDLDCLRLGLWLRPGRGHSAVIISPIWQRPGKSSSGLDKALRPFQMKGSLNNPLEALPVQKRPRRILDWRAAPLRRWPRHRPPFRLASRLKEAAEMLGVSEKDHPAID